MKWKLLDSSFDETTGISKAIIQTNLGKFEGYSKIHEEDKDIQSIYQGCRYAEMRAIIKYGKERAKILKIKVATLKEVIDIMEKLNNYDKNSAEARQIRKQYYIKKKILDNLNKQIKDMENGLYNTMKNYRKEHEDFMKSVEKKQKPTEE